ncbi:SH3 domain-containing C40 family peptidase [Paraburkholderia sp. BL10I2N1]|uniref:SH3 domain-containing C40 family peptidase n=1 Tax=Paraburkholderia sp. BL10I2N1 TaxID=1938796 RepID=UPI001FB68190|nr:SH3 domain-containing C40 family peptidase [Paraburkholderia sp. BL10I2N1]
MLIQAAALSLALAGCTGTPSSHEARTAVDPFGLFPMAAYNQDVDHWIDPSGPGYDKAFLSADDQRTHFEALYARYFGNRPDDPSPWNPAYVDSHVYRQSGSDMVALQHRRLAWFDNTDKTGKYIGYGQNFRPHTVAWIETIARNMDVDQFTRAPGYISAHRAIATGNLLVRELPTLDPSFDDRRLAGEGYPFDNLQISAVRPGTPLYVLGSSLDGGWRYVQTPDVQGWVRSEDIGMVNDAFVDRWRDATHEALGAVTVALAPVRDSRGAFRFDAPAGSLLPLLPASAPGIRNILVPARNADGLAVIRTAQLSDAQISPMPLAATPRHLARLLKTLIGRPYGWGNTGLYNDCSSELQSIFVAFGVWLPRHSSTQMSAGRMTDLSGATPAERLDYVTRHGQPMRTLIYIGGHVMLYLGNTTRNKQELPVVYQDIWGLRPADNTRRAVIGGSVILPLLERIPEDPMLESLAATPIFQISILGAPGEGTPVPPDEDNPAS